MSEGKDKKSVLNEVSQDDFNSIIDSLALQDIQKQFLKSRWLNQVLWMESRANSNQRYYYCLRLITIIGALLIPALVTLSSTITDYELVLKVITGVISLFVAISAAVEQFFNFGNRWRHYRQTVENLKIEAWRYFQLSDSYRGYSNHSDAYPDFVSIVENAIRHDVDVYVTEIVKDEKQGQTDSSLG